MCKVCICRLDWSTLRYSVLAVLAIASVTCAAIVRLSRTLWKVKCTIDAHVTLAIVSTASVLYQ